MRDDLHTYLNELERRAQQPHGLAERTTTTVLAALVLGIAAMLAWFISETPGYAILTTVVAALVVVPLFLLMSSCSNNAWLRRRPQVIQHMQRSIFGDGLLSSYLRQRGLSEAEPAAIDDFIETFMAENYGRQGYYYGLGFLNSAQHTRSALLLTLAAELRQGLSVFEEDEAPGEGTGELERESSTALQWHSQLRPAPVPEPVLRLELEERGWTPPGLQELRILESELLQMLNRPDYSPAQQAGGVCVFALAWGVAHSPGHWLPIVALGLPAAVFVALLAQSISGGSEPRRRQELLNNLHRELFEDNMLRDFIRLRRDFSEGRLAGQYVPAALQHEEEHPLQLLQWFAEHYVRLRSEPYGRNSRVYRYSGGQYLNMRRLQLLTSYAAASGLRCILEQEPQVFESW